MKQWPTKLLGEVCAINPKLTASEAPAIDAEITFVPMAAVDEVGGTIAQPQRRQYKEVAKGYTAFKDNDVLFAKITPCMQNGKAAIARNLFGGFGFGSTEFHILRPGAGVLPEWLFGFIRQPSFRSAAEANFTGTAGQQRVPTDYLKRVKIPVPPLADQARIVNLLDEVDALRKLRDQADRRTGDLVPALFNEMFGDPATNQRSWPVKPFGELAENKDGKRKPVKASDRADRKGEYPYYGASGIIDYVDKYLFDETALLIGEDGANLLARSTPIAFLAHGRYWVNNHAHVVTFNGKADLNYLCVALNLRDLADFVTGSAQPKLNQANMNRILIPVPPMVLQKEFGRRVTEIRELEAEQAASRRRGEDLYQSMLHRAFSGEL